MKYFLILKLMLISKIGISQIMLPAYQGVVSKIPAVVTPSFSCGPSTVSDIDGNIYNTVLINKQCWTASNLRVTKYNDGTAIPLNATGGSVGTSETWQNENTGAYTIYGNEASSDANATNYGFLYNWYAVKGIITAGGPSTKNICPTGWHVPTDTELTTLTNFLEGNTVAGGKMKSVGTSYWFSPNTDATNESGFSSLPGGWRNNVGNFVNIRTDAFYWSFSYYIGTNAWSRSLLSNHGRVVVNVSNTSIGASVRCLRD